MTIQPIRRRTSERRSRRGCASGFERRHAMRDARQRHAPAPVERRGGLSRRRQQPPLAGEAHQRLLQLLERAHLDLADALAADVVDLAQLLERLGLVGQAPLGQDVLLAVVERVHRLDQQLVADLRLLGLGDALVLERLGVDQPVLPAAFACPRAAAR